MATSSTSLKTGSQARDGLPPTPLRRRTASLGPVPTSRAAAPPVILAATAASNGGAVPAALPAPGPQKHNQGTIVIALACCLVALLCFVPAPPKDGAARVPRAVHRDVSHDGLPLKVASALSCEAQRADITDILAGAPYEFLPRSAAADGNEFERLPRLVTRAQHEQQKGSVTRAETELKDAVVSLCSSNSSWPSALRQRLMAAMDGPCQVRCGKGAWSASRALLLDIDDAYTSSGAVTQRSNFFHQALLDLGAATGIPLFRARADLYRSRPASVVVSSEAVEPRDCFATRGSSTVALRLPHGTVIRQIVIEQPPRWETASQWSTPAHFEVWGEPLTRQTLHTGNPYTVLLGSFTYAAAAPAAQAFKLPETVPIRGILLSFSTPASHGPGDILCLYRVRAFASETPSCKEADGKSSARIVVPWKA